MFKILKIIKNKILRTHLSKYTTFLILTNCASFNSFVKPDANPINTLKVVIPDLKNTENECYFIEDVLPTPSSLLKGKNQDGLELRYYTYELATYKDWSNQKIYLSFHSTSDPKCWSLFEEKVEKNFLSFF